MALSENLGNSEPDRACGIRSHLPLPVPPRQGVEVGWGLVHEEHSGLADDCSVRSVLPSHSSTSERLGPSPPHSKRLRGGQAPTIATFVTSPRYPVTELSLIHI